LPETVSRTTTGEQAMQVECGHLHPHFDVAKTRTYGG
jgi:hypothetical protein